MAIVFADCAIYNENQQDTGGRRDVADNKTKRRRLGGGGGGRPDMAQAGGKDHSKLPEALAQVETLVAAQLKK